MSEVTVPLSVGLGRVLGTSEGPDVARAVTGGTVVTRLDTGVGPIPVTLPLPTQEPDHPPTPESDDGVYGNSGGSCVRVDTGLGGERKEMGGPPS